MLLLAGERCRVRSWRGSDLESIVRHANNPKVAMQLRDRFPHPYTRADGIAFLRHMTGPEPQTNFAIEVDGEAAGAIGFVRGADVERFSAEIGYWLGEAYWGRGIATDAVRAITDHIFANFDVCRIYATVFESNPASSRVLDKAGFVLEGRLRKAVTKSGETIDALMYAVLREDA